MSRARCTSGVNSPEVSCPLRWASSLRADPAAATITLARMATSSSTPTDHQLLLGRVASVLVGLQAVVIAGFAIFYLVELVLGEGSDPVIVLMSALTMVIFVVGLSYVSAGLWRRHPRAQAPAIAFNFLLVPLGIAMFQFAPPLLAGAILVVAVLTIAATALMGRLD